MALYKGTDPFSKMVKVFQYTAVIIAEYNLMRYALKLLNGTKPTERHVKHWYNRWRALGSDLSTVRMMFRTVIWFNSAKFFL